MSFFVWPSFFLSLAVRSDSGSQCRAEDAKCDEGIANSQLQISQVERRSKLELDEFIREFESKHVPVVITDYEDRITRRKAINLKRIKKLCGKKMVTPYAFNPSSTEWARMDIMPEMRVRDFLEYFQQEVKSPSSSHPLYMLDWVLLNNCPELGRTLTIPKYVVRDAQKLLMTDAIQFYELADSPWPSLFMSPSTLHGSGLHVDGGNSSFWMYLARGKKRWRIVDAAHVKHLGPQTFPGRVTMHLEADLIEPNFDRFPGLASVNVWEADLAPGDLIIVPGGSAHQVQNLAASIAIAGNYVSPYGMKHHQRFLHSLLESKLGEEKAWPEEVRKSLHMYADQRFLKDVNAAFPKVDLSFDTYHAGFSLPGW